LSKASITIWLLALVLLSDGCSWFRRGRKTASPPPPKQATQPAPPPPAAPKKRSSTPRTSPGAPKAAPPALKPQPAEAAPAKAVREPVLGQLITEEQKTEYRRTYDENASEANRLLASFSAKKLVKEQVDTVGRIRSFLQQAGEAKATDWSLAANLARRALLLARELAQRLQ
jgi:hypothetical protein